APEVITENEFPARTPVDRAQERHWRQGEHALIEARKKTGDADTAWHARNFLDCVKSRQACNCDVETGHRSTSATLIGNVALRSNSVIEWDATQERIPNHSKANDLLSYRYRAPWRLA